jgi:hypothetical protein
MFFHFSLHPFMFLLCDGNVILVYVHCLFYVLSSGLGQNDFRFMFLFISLNDAFYLISISFQFLFSFFYFLFCCCQVLPFVVFLLLFAVPLLSFPCSSFPYSFIVRFISLYLPLISLFISFDLSLLLSVIVCSFPSMFLLLPFPLLSDSSIVICFPLSSQVSFKFL